MESKATSILKDNLHHFVLVKLNCELFALYTKPVTDTFDTKSFIMKNELITQSGDLNSIFENFGSQLVTKAGDFQGKGFW